VIQETEIQEETGQDDPGQDGAGQQAETQQDPADAIQAQLEREAEEAFKRVEVLYGQGKVSHATYSRAIETRGQIPDGEYTRRLTQAQRDREIADQRRQAGLHPSDGSPRASEHELDDTGLMGIRLASDQIEAEIAAEFEDTLGSDRVEEIRQGVIRDSGSHALFARRLGEAANGQTRQETIQAEVQAALVQAGLAKRESFAGADKVSERGKGPKPSSYEEVEAAYARGEASTAQYEAARKARREAGEGS